MHHCAGMINSQEDGSWDANVGWGPSEYFLKIPVLNQVANWFE